MTTCYVRIIIVLGLLRQAIGLQSLPPSQVMTSIALFMTLFVMTPVWTRVYDDAIEPYTNPDVEMSLEEAYEAGSIPVREFMARQIDVAGNHDDVDAHWVKEIERRAQRALTGDASSQDWVAVRQRLSGAQSE